MLTPQDVAEKAFSVARMGAGYAKKEVDDFLDLVHDELAKAQNMAQAAQDEARRLASQLSAAQSQPTVTIAAVPSGASSSSTSGVTMDAPAAPVESSITKILQRAQQLADELLGDAKVEAERVKAEALVEADKLKNAAQADAEQAKADLAAQVAKLQSDSDAISSANAVAAKILGNALAALTPPQS